MGKRFFISAATRADRHEMTKRAGQAISVSGGWVLDHHWFSNLSLSIFFEISEGKLVALLDALAVTGLSVSRRSAEDAGQRTAAAAGGEVEGYLQITFIHDEPDLRREVPAIPG